MTNKAITTDFIVVGQGITGTSLAYFLEQNNQKFVVIDDQHLAAASRIAPAFINPIVFKRLTSTWLASEILPFAKKFYEELEKKLNKTFYFPHQTYKIFSNDQEKEFWQRQLNENKNSDYIGEILAEVMGKNIKLPFGAGQVKQTAFVEMGKLVKAYAEYLLEKHQLTPEKIDYALLKISSEKVNYKNIQAKYIIFAEGYQIINNPYFNYLPMKLTKGEAISIKTVENLSGITFKKNISYINLDEKKAWLAATYNWDDLDERCTEKAKNDLLMKAEKMIPQKNDSNILEHVAGIRPTVEDRRPLIGQHEIFKNVFVCNGMGTKGTLLAPYFANQLINSIVHKQQICAETQIHRFLKKLT